LAYYDYSNLVVAYGIAIVLVCAAFLRKGKWDPISEKGASLTYGIYLIHPFVYSLLRIVGIAELNPWLIMVVVFLLSSLTTLILKKTPFVKQFV
jgi:peptidoglycan/LPS O-acetylase OafA/YrhL